MAKDLKHRVKAIRQQNPRHGRSNRLPRIGLGVIVGGLLLAIVAAGYRQMPALALTPAAEPAPAPPPPPPPPPPAPKFAYFKILPGIERAVPDAEIHHEQREVRLGRAPTPGQYFLQIGAFREQAAAEELRESLRAFGKFRPRLEQVRLEYATWYRLRLGPYRTLLDAEQVRQFLREQDIDSIVQMPVPDTAPAGTAGG